MNTVNKTDRNDPNPTAAHRFLEACIAPCQKLVAHVQKTKNALLAEFRETRQAHEQLLRLALLEAEALAWQTPYPHLVYPALAREKAEAVAAWTERQRFIQTRDRVLSFAA